MILVNALSTEWLPCPKITYLYFSDSQEVETESQKV